VLVIDWSGAIVCARVIVAGGGETAMPPWWRSKALTPAGGRMLERLFPRTVQSARLETSRRAAAIEHDAHIGRIGTFHLFRLPTGDEAVIREFLRSAKAVV
jgi:predicted NBD/HSP70 family sugar kinase